MIVCFFNSLFLMSAEDIWGRKIHEYVKVTQYTCANSLKLSKYWDIYLEFIF